MANPKPEFNFPELCVPPESFLDHVAKNPTVPIRDLLKPFNDWEGILRSVYAQDHENPIVQGDRVNLIDVFRNGNAEKVRVRGRNLDDESQEEIDKWVPQEFLLNPSDLQLTPVFRQVHYAIGC